MVHLTGNGHQPDLLSPGGARAPRVAVLLSQRLAQVGPGLALADLDRWLQQTLPAVDVQVVTDLVKQPGEIARLLTAGRAERLVLGLAPGEQATAEIQAQARKAGLDPLGVVILNLGAHAALWASEPAATERAKLLLAAAVASARAFAGSQPENLKGALSVAVSRRALFKLAVREYQAVPAPLAGRCVAERGCQVCVDTCPRQAIRLRDRQIELSKSGCDSCGLCVTACPADALTFPGYSLAELDAQITTLLNPRRGDITPRGILFVCRGSAPILEAAVERGARYPAGWLPVGVSCAGAVSPGLILYCLALGAAGVGLAACQEQCQAGQGAVVAERVAFCQELLRLMGGLPERVKLCPVAVENPVAWALPPAGGPPARHLAGMAARDRRGAAQAILHLAQTHPGPGELTLEHAQAPFGIVELDANGCTGCEACAEACPTGALAVSRDENAVSITFDPALCTACGVCMPRCPEVGRDVLRVDRVVDIRRLQAGRTTVYRDQAARCLSCGAMVAPSGMIARLAELLGDQYAALAPMITRYCSDCRGAPLPVSQNGSRW